MNSMFKKIIITLLIFFISFEIYGNELIDVAAGKYHTLLLFDNGKILSFGDNYFGQLGLSSEQNISCGYIEAPVKFISIAVGLWHSLAVADDGSLWGWGTSIYRQLGEKKETDITKPMMLDNSKNWVKVFADGYESLGMKKDGSVWNIRLHNMIINPEKNKWRDVQIFASPWGMEDYTLCVVLTDEKGKQWAYGSSNTDSKKFYILTSFLEYEGEFRELIPLNSSNGINEFQATDFSAAYRQKEKLFIVGLSTLSYRNIQKIWKYLKSRKYFINKFINKFMNKKIKEEAAAYTKFTTGNFSDFFETFLNDAALYSANMLTEDSMHFYSYTALLKKNGQMVLWTNRKRFVSDKDLKIKNIFGGYSIFVQTEDDKIYVIGYDIGNRLGMNKNEDEFLFMEPLDFLTILNDTLNNNE